MIIVWTTLAGTPVAEAQTAIVYRFDTGTATGTVWLAGDKARLESDPKDDTARNRRIELSRDGGTQLLVLNASDRTYYDSVAYQAGRPVPSLAPLNVREPLVVGGVEKVLVGVDPPLTGEETSDGKTDACRRVTVTLSYSLQLRLTMAEGLFPGRVQGRGEFCLTDSLPVTTLPFGHGLQFVSGIPQVDALLAERLAALKGIPIKRTLVATRQIQGGESVSETATLVLSDFREAQVPPDRFEVPPGYRYQEPVIIGPNRQEP